MKKKYIKKLDVMNHIKSRSNRFTIREVCEKTGGSKTLVKDCLDDLTAQNIVQKSGYFKKRSVLYEFTDEEKARRAGVATGIDKLKPDQLKVKSKPKPEVAPDLDTVPLYKFVEPDISVTSVLVSIDMRLRELVAINRELVKIRQEVSDMKCDKCEQGYPDIFLQPLVSSQGSWNVCPECALKIMEEIHGVPFEEFQGYQAQKTLEDFRDWKVKHGK